MAQFWRGMAVCAAAVVVASAAGQDCDGWVPVGDPGWRQNSAAAFDPVRGVVLVFGGTRQPGATGEHIYADTWTHDGRRWSYVPAANPTLGKIAALMTFDPVSGKMLLHGGRATNSSAAETSTWAFDGAEWTLFATGGPAALNSHSAFGYDPVAGVHWCSVPTTTGAARLWRLAGGVWSEVLPAEGQLWPGANVGGQGTFDSVRNRLVVFAYTTGEIWEWDGATGVWTVVPGAFAPAQFFTFTRFADAPALGGVMVAQSAAAKVWNGTQLVALPTGVLPHFQTHSTQNAFTFPDGLPGLIGDFTTSATDAAGTLRVMRIGADATAVWPGRTSPAGRMLASLGSYPGHGTMLVGGSLTNLGDCPSNNPGSNYLGDTWLLRGERWQRLATGGVGFPLNAPLLYDPTEGTMVFPQYCSVRTGGTTSRSARWDGSAWQPWTFTFLNPQPGPSAYNAWTIDHETGRVWVLSQSTSAVTARQTGAMAWTTLTGTGNAPVQERGTMAFDPVRGALVHGGQSNGGPTRAYNVATGVWSVVQNHNSSPSVPFPGEWAPGCTYDPGRGGVVIFGGFRANNGASFPRNTYFLPSTANTWQQITSSNVPGRKYMRIAYEHLSERIVMFGGDNFNDMGDTWKLARGPARVAVPPPPVTAAAGESAVLEVVAKGGGAIRYQWRRNNQPLTENARIDGVRTDLLTITGLLGSDAGDYTCVVTNDCGTETSVAARLTVTGAVCPADVGSAGGEEGPDGQLDNNDFIVFINWFFETDARADMGSAGGVAGSDGAFDNNDFIAFIDFFFTPC